MIKTYFSRKIEMWALKKNKKISNIYIIPTIQGLSYLATNFLIFLVGLTYANNIVLLISFILISYFIMTMIKSHFYLNSIKVESLSIQDNHQNVGSIVKVKLDKTPPNLDFEIYSPQNQIKLFKNSQNFTLQNLKRGLYQGRFYKLTSTGPNNLFRTWRYYNNSYSFYIYPSLLIDQSLLKLLETQININDLQDYSGHCPFEKGMSIKSIDWKRYSKVDQLFVKTYSSTLPIEIEIDLKDLDGDLETSISKAAWLINFAFNNDFKWSLKTSHFFMKGQQGLKDYHHCNQKLSCL